MFVTFGPLFPVYVGTFALAGSALAVLASTFDLGQLVGAIDQTRFPRRAAAGLGVFMAMLLGGMWLPMVLANLTATTVEPLDGATTLVVRALDLGFLVPLGVFTTVLVWRRAAAGYLLASVVVVKAVAMALAIVSMLLVEAAETGVLSAPPIAVFALTAAAAAAIGWRVLGSVRTTASGQPAIAGASPSPMPG